MHESKDNLKLSTNGTSYNQKRLLPSYFFISFSYLAMSLIYVFAPALLVVADFSLAGNDMESVKYFGL